MSSTSWNTNYAYFFDFSIQYGHGHQEMSNFLQYDIRNRQIVALHGIQIIYSSLSLC